MAITNNMGVWGTESDYGSSWYSVSQGRITGFQQNAINYASKMNQALKNATLLSYTFAELLSEEVTSSTFTIGAQEVTDLTTFVPDMKTAVNSYINKAVGTYAGGTNITLNNISKTGSTASFYAPTDAGTNGQILKSNGSGAPEWISALFFNAIKKNAGVESNLSINHTYLLVPKPGDKIDLYREVEFKTYGGNTIYSNAKHIYFYGPVIINVSKYQHNASSGSDTSSVSIDVSYILTQDKCTATGNSSMIQPATLEYTIKISSDSAYTYYDITN